MHINFGMVFWLQLCVSLLAEMNVYGTCCTSDVCTLPRNIEINGSNYFLIARGKYICFLFSFIFNFLLHIYILNEKFLFISALFSSACGKIKDHRCIQNIRVLVPMTA